MKTEGRRSPQRGLFASWTVSILRPCHTSFQGVHTSLSQTGMLPSHNETRPSGSECLCVCVCVRTRVFWNDCLVKLCVFLTIHSLCVCYWSCGSRMFIFPLIVFFVAWLVSVCLWIMLCRLTFVSEWQQR